MDLQTAIDAARDHHESTLVTLRRNGRPQLSNVMHGLGADGVLRISSTTDRAKVANLRREGWAALHLNVGSFWSYLVLEGEVTLSEVAADPHDPAADELVETYRSISGEHEDWEDYRAAMVRDRRLVIRLQPGHAYGALR